ncbi:hypothetical protein HQ708_07040 [Enterococcus faecium]|nr:hypothetical protein [Enterococcus faecium]
MKKINNSLLELIISVAIGTWICNSLGSEKIIPNVWIDRVVGGTVTVIMYFYLLNKKENRAE